MRFLVDEGLPVRLGSYLNAAGHDAKAVGRDYPFALADHVILELAVAEQRIVLTNDKDFGDLIFRDRLPHAGVILFRLGYVLLDTRIIYLERALNEYADQLHDFIVITHRDIRVRSSD